MNPAVPANLFVAIAAPVQVKVVAVNNELFVTVADTPILIDVQFIPFVFNVQDPFITKVGVPVIVPDVYVRVPVL